jgi:hypothetical protein
MRSGVLAYEWVAAARQTGGGILRNVPSLAELRSRIDAASAAYSNEFAGKDRGTRELQRLEQLLADARAIVTLLERRLGPPRPAEKELLARARKHVELFAGERAAIAEARKRGPFTPDEQVLVDLGARGKAVNGILRRAFDPSLAVERIDLAALFDVAEEMAAIEEKMLAATPKQSSTWMVQGLQAVRQDIAVCEQQRLRIVEAWSTGPTDTRREFLHALAADARAIADEEDRDIAPELRRPARRRHMAAAMRLIAERLRALGPLTGADGDVLGALNDRAASLEAARSSPSLASLSRELEAVNKLYAANFAKRMREEVSLPLLRSICTRAVHATLQVFDITEADRTDATVRALRRARQLLWIFDGEYDAVARAQKK